MPASRRATSWAAGLLALCSLLGSGCPGKADSTPAVLATAEYRGDVAQEQSGAYVGPAGDINGDGYADVLIGTSQEGSLIAAVMAGTSEPNSKSLGEAVLDFTTAGEWDAIHTSAAGVGDVNADGFDDLLVSVREQFTCYLMFGADEPRSLSIGDDLVELSAAAYAVAAAGDMNADGFDDMLVMGYDLVIVPGAARIASADIYGVDGAGVRHASDHDEMDMTSSVVGGTDLDGDGFDDGVATAYGYRYTSFYLVRGAAQLESGSLSAADARFDTRDGYGAVSEAGDTDGDGYADVVLYTDRSYLVLGSAVPRWTSLADSAGLILDEQAHGIGDVDGDGFDDLGLSHWADAWVDYGAASAAGREEGPPFAAPQGALTTIDAAGDVNQDGLDDWLVSSCMDDVGSLYNAGITYLILGAAR